MTEAPARAAPKRAGKQFTVWVRLGFGFSTGIFLEDITKYQPDPKQADMWHRATLTLDPQRAPKARRK